MFGERPKGVVFEEIIALPNQYLVFVTSIDFDSLKNLSPDPFDISQIDSRKLQLKVLTGFGTTLLKRGVGCSSCLSSTTSNRYDGNHITLPRTPNQRRGRCSSSSRHALRSGRELINNGLNLDNFAIVADLQNAIHHKRFRVRLVKKAYSVKDFSVKSPNVKHLRYGLDVTKVLEHHRHFVLLRFRSSSRCNTRKICHRTAT